MHHFITKFDSSASHRNRLRGVIFITVPVLVLLGLIVASFSQPHLIHTAAHVPWLAAFWFIGKFPAVSLVLLSAAILAGGALWIYVLLRLSRR